MHKKWILSITAVAVLVSIAFVYGYWRKNISSPTQTTSTFSYYPFELITELNKTEFQHGELIYVNVRLRNVSNQTMVVNWSSSYHFDFNITDENGNFVYQWSNNYAFGDSAPLTLEPNQGVNDSLESFVVDETSITMTPLQLPNGKYQLIGFINRYFWASFANSGQLIEGILLQTPPLTIVVW
jgi:hypothetical protein